MSQYISLLQSNGQFLKVLTDDDGIIQYTTNGDAFQGVPAGDATNAVHADTADTATTATSATTAAGPANATTFADSLGLDWPEAIKRRVLALDSTLTRMPVWSYCTNINADLSFGSAAGTGAVAVLGTTVGGGIENTSGSTNGGSRVMALGLNTLGGARYVANCRTGHWAVYMRVKVVTAPAGGTANLLATSIQDGTNDVGLGIKFADSATNWVFRSGAASVDTTIAFDGNWTDLLIWNDGTHINPYIGLTAVTPLLSATYLDTTPGYSRSYAQNGNQDAVVNIYVNRWAIITPSV